MDDDAVLAVDLDGTLLKTDTLWEGVLEVVRHPRRWPVAIPRLVGSLLRGKAEFKEVVAELAPLSAISLPFRDDLVRWLRDEHTRGRTLVLATGAPAVVAEAVARELGIFTSVFSTQGSNNLTASRKRLALDSALGTGAWDYVGDSSDDIEVWAGARVAYTVDPAASLVRRAQARGIVLQPVAARSSASLAIVARAVRVHQWVKNLLIFAPAVLAHRAGVAGDVAVAALAFLAFSLVASATYIFNDLLDLPSDRLHRGKRERPLASGRLLISSGVGIGALFVLAAIAVSLLLPLAFRVVLLGYAALTLSYSLDLKRRPLVDVVVLAGLYTMRLVAGAVATQVELSFWLLAFSMFLFFSLALAKRATELGRLDPEVSRPAGRGYARGDLEPLTAIGAASGTTAVMVFALYLNTTVASALYPHAKALWLMCPLFLYWVTRLWLYVRRGWIDDDPVVFALRDRTSRLCGLAGVLIFAGALLPW